MEDENKPGGGAGDSSPGKLAETDQPASPTPGEAGSTPPAAESSPKLPAETPAAKPTPPIAADVPAAKPAVPAPPVEKPTVADTPAAKPEAPAAPDAPAIPAAPSAAAKQEDKPPPAAKAEDKPAPAAEAKKEPPPKPAKKPAVMETAPWEGSLPDALKERFGEQIKEFLSYRDQNFLLADVDAAVSIIEYLKVEQDFDYLVDITAVDDPEQEKRFELVWILYSFARNERVRIKARLGEEDSAQTVVGVHITADWLEREVFDMFGVRFEGHPNMTRILLPEEWQGHPLRKDYSIIQQDEDWVRENLQIESGQ